VPLGQLHDLAQLAAERGPQHLLEGQAAGAGEGAVGADHLGRETVLVGDEQPDHVHVVEVGHRPRALELSAALARWGGETVVTDGIGRPASPWSVERAMRSSRTKVPGLPQGFRFHDLRHYLASLLIGSGADVKVMQARLRHASAKTTLDTYGHLWPDADESARAAVGAVLTARADYLRTRDMIV